MQRITYRIKRCWRVLLIELVPAAPLITPASSPPALQANSSRSRKCIHLPVPDMLKNHPVTTCHSLQLLQQPHYICPWDLLDQGQSIKYFGGLSLCLRLEWSKSNTYIYIYIFRETVRYRPRYVHISSRLL